MGPQKLQSLPSGAIEAQVIILYAMCDMWMK